MEKNENLSLSSWKEIEIAATRNQELQILREAYGTEALQQWGAGMLELLQQACLLRESMHEGSVQEQTKDRDELECYAQICKSKEGTRMLRDLRESWKNRRTSQGHESAEQQPGEPTETLQGMSLASTQKAEQLLDLWRSCQGLELLREALSEIQKARRSNGYSVSETAGGTQARKYVLRRLTPLETLRLQGLPDWWCNGANGSDSAIYKMAGNGLAIPCAYDVMRRIAGELEGEK